LIVGLLGLKAAGVPGALVATLAMLGPSCLLMFGVCRAWDRFRETKWRIAFEKGVAPVAVGLVFASALTVTRAADHGAAGYLLTATTTALFAYTGVNPLLVMAAAGVLGAMGLV